MVGVVGSKYDRPKFKASPMKKLINKPENVVQEMLVRNLLYCMAKLIMFGT